MNDTTAGTAVADGVYRCGSDRVNWYLIDADDGLVVVDTGFPSHWNQLLELLESLEYDVTDVDACLLTHAHPDHAGFADRLRTEADVPVWLHEADAEHARGEGDLAVAQAVARLWRPELFRYFLEFARSGGFSVPPLTTFRSIDGRETLDVPGSPRVIHVPGHTEGHVAFYFPDHEVLVCGDEIVTVDFVAGRGHRPQLLAAWFNADHEQADDSLARLEPIGEVLLLPGHGDPWRGRTETAVDLARRRE
ncbi:MBL fold metallo-hydrolase [Halopiger djelfimassiliensis]|uniref:MBL fold metallo-hydrolase n=1 Tax=Halopiger djelfimassiliensis TaxID=1293047 RepID=UPI0012B56310|nr:MBL fold metallo-hydrolase [Halopiger djelfimassiliensis]